MTIDFSFTSSSIQSFEIAAKVLGGSFLVGNEELSIRAASYRIVFRQQERYREDFVCFLQFFGGPSVFVEDVAEAMSYDLRGSTLHRPWSEEKERESDAYALSISRFIEDRREVLLEWPPSWLRAALLNGVRRTMRHFPDIARQEITEIDKFLSTLGIEPLRKI